MSKEIYVPVDGIAHKATKVYAPVNGVARSVKKVYKGVNGVARQVYEALPTLAPVFANNTWADIILACQAGAVPDTWAVGDQLTMTIDGVDYDIDIIGKNHDDYADSSGKAPLTFQMHGVYANRRTMNSGNTNAGGWRDSNMRNTHLPAIMALMPSEVQAGIREVFKKTSAGSQSGDIVTTADKLFLLSEIEVFGEISHSFAGEGSQYAYYASVDTSGKAGNLWERSPYTGSNMSFCNVSSYGEMAFDVSSASLYVSFAFCF